ncbi:glycosyltransferase family 4 protein [Bowmanella denitrificans]|uniref:glycosyltransferase family 4 protein n=1 Tax=Bowmanella denitrificans TaxID=366582 RepID=UPI0031DCF2BD
MAQLSKYDVQIEVVTTLPNRYSTFSTKAKAYEKSENVAVHRIALPSHKSGMLDQIKAFYAYYKQVKKLVKEEDYQLVFATSSRLFTAFLGAMVARQKRIPLYLDIRDIFVDTMGDVLPRKVAFVVKPFLSVVERYTFSKAQKINLVSGGFKTYFKTRFPDKTYRWFSNGIDEEFLKTDVLNSNKEDMAKRLIVLYAGNLGEGQGMHKIIPELAVATSNKLFFRIIGDGGRKQALMSAVEGFNNVELLPPVSRTQLVAEYQNADILLLHLNDYAAFEKVLPSKVFEYAATGKPIWAGVGGFAAEFIKNEVCNSAVFSPCNHTMAIERFDELELIQQPRQEFINKFSRSNIMQKMAEDIIETTNASSH